MTIRNDSTTAELNIGLKTSKGQDLESSAVVEYLVGRLSRYAHKDDIVSMSWRVAEAFYEHEGRDVVERTLVIMIENVHGIDRVFPDLTEVYLWSDRLEQECIAVRYTDLAAGQIFEALAGPEASNWGPFNPDYFIAY